MNGVETLSAEAVEPAAMPEADAAVDQLRSSQPLVALRLADPTVRVAALENVLSRVTDDDTRIVWVGNPLRSPLTLERLFMQVVGPEVDLKVERSPAELAALLARAPGRRARLLVIVQQPDTLGPETLETLGRMAPHFAGTDPSIQILFCGPLCFELPQLLPPAPEAPLPAPRYIDLEPAPATPRSELFPYLLLLLVVGGAAGLYWLDNPTAPSPARPGHAPAAQVASAPPVLPAHRIDPPAAAPSEDVAALRREFDAFLAQRAPAISALGEKERDALFADFLARRRQTAGAAIQ